MPYCRAVGLDPRPRSCGKTNHIQWLSLRPAVSSARTLLNSGSCAATKRVRSYRSSIAQAVAADPDPAFCTILPLSVRCFCAGGGGAAALLESAPRVFLVDAVDPAGIGRPGAGLGGVIDEQQHPPGFTRRAISLRAACGSIFGHGPSVAAAGALR